MSQGDTPITLVGNLVDDLELRYTQSGTPVASGRVATNPRRYDSQSGQWVDDEPLFMRFTIWRSMAETAANSVTKGTRVIITGNLKQTSYETREGEKRTVYEVDAQDIGPSLKFATAQVAKAPRQGGGFGGNQGESFGGRQEYSSGGFGGGFPPADDDPWGAK